MADSKLELNKEPNLNEEATEDNEQPLLAEPEEPPTLYKEEPWR
jgi:hypothetical protein